MIDRTYVKTYFRVECGYVWGKGIEDDALFAFNIDVKELLGEIGFTVLRESGQEMLGSCLKMVCGKERLYCHPMDLSGPVLVNRVARIKSQLARAKRFRLRAVDTYETVIDYTKDELKQILVREADELRCMIYLALCTPWVHRFRDELSVQNVLSHTCDRFAGQFVNILDTNEHAPLIGSTVKSTFETMINDDLIIRTEHEGRIFYRSRNKGELRKLHLLLPTSRQADSRGLPAMALC